MHIFFTSHLKHLRNHKVKYLCHYRKIFLPLKSSHNAFNIFRYITFLRNIIPFNSNLFSTGGLNISQKAFFLKIKYGNDLKIYQVLPPTPLAHTHTHTVIVNLHFEVV